MESTSGSTRLCATAPLKGAGRNKISPHKIGSLTHSLVMPVEYSQENRRISSMKTLLFYLSGLAFVCSSCIGQVGPWPSWANDNIMNDAPLASHPSLGSVQNRWYRLRLTEAPVWEGAHGYYSIAWHAMHGDMAVRRRATSTLPGSNLGSLDPGLSYILCYQEVSTNGAPRGILVCGVDSQGLSVVRFMAWDGRSTPSNTWTSLATATSTQERWLISSVVDGDLVVLDAASERIKRFDDTDQDGLPDATTPSINYPVNHVAGPVTSFYKLPSGELCMGSLLLHIQSHNIVTPTGVVFRQRPPVNSPSLRGYRACGGLKVLRISYRGSSKCKVLDSNQKAISSAHPGGGSPQWDVPLWRPLVAGETIYLWAQRNGENPTVSPPITVLPNAMTAFPALRVVYDDHSEKIRIVGGNWPADLVISGKFDGLPLSTVAWQKVDDNTLIVSPPDAAAGAPPLPLQLILRSISSPTNVPTHLYLIVDQL